MYNKYAFIINKKLNFYQIKYIFWVKLFNSIVLVNVY